MALPSPCFPVRPGFRSPAGLSLLRFAPLSSRVPDSAVFLVVGYLIVGQLFMEGDDFAAEFAAGGFVWGGNTNPARSGRRSRVVFWA
jgi:hypothetical protein